MLSEMNVSEDCYSGETHLSGEVEQTETASKAAGKLRERVLPMLSPEQNDDAFLMRWLIARKFNLDKAEEMLVKHIKFMKLNGLDKVDDYVLPEASDYFYTAFLGYDYEGSIVRLLHVGATDIRGICFSIPKLESMRLANYTLVTDFQKQAVDRKNDVICDKQVYIMDFQGLSWRVAVQRMVMDRAFYLLKAYEANYPERLKVTYFVNVPSFFGFIYSWLKNILPESIITKLEFLSQEEIAPKLGQIMDLAILPAVYGGKRTDPDGDPNCNSLYPKPLGTPVPEEFLSIGQLENLKNDPDAKKIMVDYSSVFIVEKVITEPNSLILWDFQTLDYDIRMGLRYKPQESAESEEIIPPHRVDSHVFPESGNFFCENTGIYELVFDNTYSWMTSKELIIKVQIQPPSENVSSE